MIVRVSYVSNLIPLGKISGERSPEFPVVVYVSFVGKSDRTAVAGELGGAALSYLASKTGLS